MLFEVGKVFVTADDIVNRDTLSHGKEVEILRVTDIGLGLYSNIGEEAYIIDHFKEIVARFGRDKLVELWAGNDSTNFIEFLLTNIYLHIMATQDTGQTYDACASSSPYARLTSR